jgi:hypothetical protein
VDVSRLASLAQAAGWQVELHVNLGHPDYASMGSEAQAAMQALGGRLVGMGCGNEPNLFASGGLRPKGYGYTQFKPEFERCAAALAAPAPTSSAPTPTPAASSRSSRSRRAAGSACSPTSSTPWEAAPARPGR